MRKTLYLLLTMITVFLIAACETIETKNFTEINVDNSIQSSNELESDKELEVVESLIDNFINKFNELSDTPITDKYSFDPTDKESGFYKTEYRLGQWKGSIGEIGRIGEHIIEITNYDSNNKLRIYVTTDTTEEILTIFPLVAKAMDSTVTDEEIENVIDYVNKWGEKNGIYIGKLRGTIISHKNYVQLMLDIS